MTTPAQDAPLVFPSVAFRPLRLLIVCVVLTAIAVAAAWFTGHPFFGVFFGVGLVLGLLNAMLVKRAVEAITAEDHPLKKKMALNSASRLLVISAVALAIAFFFRNNGGSGRGVRTRGVPGAAGDEHQHSGTEEDPNRRSGFRGHGFEGLSRVS